MASDLHRRRFLALTGGTAGALALGSCAWRDAVEQSIAESTTTSVPTTSVSPTSTRDVAPTEPADGSLGDPGRPLLVVVNLGGGNDALNTVIPRSGSYHDLRPAVGIPDEQQLALSSDYALHPSLSPLLPYWERSSMAVVQGVGMEGQSRSHFAATDALFAGQVEYNASGWLGRWLDLHPNAGVDPLLAVALGGGRNAVVGQTASSTVITRPDQFLLQTAPGMDVSALADVLLATATSTNAVAGPNDVDALNTVRAGIPRAMEAIGILDQIGTNAESTSVNANSAQSLLAVAAQIVRLNLSTEVMMIDLGGFDTHAQQSDTHANLLGDLATGIDELLTTLAELDTPRDVVVLTTSEFGRRAEDNGSGTDHGSAGSSLMIGSGVTAGIVGDLGVDRLVDGDLPIEVDTRSVYAAAIEHLGGSVEATLGGDFDSYDLIS